MIFTLFLALCQRGLWRDWVTVEKNLSALADCSGRWIDIVHGRRPPRGIVLDMDSSVSPTHGEQEDNAVRLQLHALAYNLGNFLRTLATPKPIKH
jgi:hypothetical protein